MKTSVRLLRREAEIAQRRANERAAQRLDQERTKAAEQAALLRDTRVAIETARAVLDQATAMLNRLEAATGRNGGAS